MPPPPDSISEGVEYSGCPSTDFVLLFVQTDLVTAVSHEQIEQFG